MPTPIVIPGDASGGGVSLATYVDRLADELGFLLETTVTAEGASGEAQRVVLADELRDDEAGYDLLGESWLYARSGDQAGVQNRVISADGVGYQGQNSAVILARPFAAPLQTGDAIVVTSPLPVLRYATVKGLRDCINEALGLIWVTARLTFTGNGTDSYSLAAYPWLWSIDQTRGIYDTPEDDPTRSPVLSSYDYEIVTTGVDRTLVTRRLWVYDTSETFYLDVVVRADRLVYDGVSWTYGPNNGTPGLQDETFMAAVPEDWVVAFGMVRALSFITRMVLSNKRLSKEEKAAILYSPGGVMERRRTWAITALRIKRALFPTPLPQRRQGLVGAASVVPWTW